VNAVAILEYPNIKEQCDLLANGKKHGYALKNFEIDKKIRRKKNVNFKKKSASKVLIS